MTRPLRPLFRLPHPFFRFNLRPQYLPLLFSFSIRMLIVFRWNPSCYPSQHSFLPWLNEFQRSILPLLLTTSNLRFIHTATSSWNTAWKLTIIALFQYCISLDSTPQGFTNHGLRYDNIFTTTPRSKITKCPCHRRCNLGTALPNGSCNTSCGLNMSLGANSALLPWQVFDVIAEHQPAVSSQSCLAVFEWA